ncbi:5'-nucleotidase [Sarcoptes scabiei]|uniref:5'-nucleotidase n=1 Tax=Sarcoptes scabiei TaxID=52283 RepID=A0A834RBN1_SARSC|nr:5'-nucleotidase [Sarcoptes scabiei]
MLNDGKVFRRFSSSISLGLVIILMLDQISSIGTFPHHSKSIDSIETLDDEDDNNESNNNDGLHLTLIHNNDFHANYLPIKTWNNAECFEDYENNPACVGGVARTVAKVKEFRKNFTNLLFLNAGDHFQGTSWYTLLKSDVVAKFVRLMDHDAMALGNHEFDNGPPELEHFIRLMTGPDSQHKLPILCSNIVLNETSILNNLIQKSMVKIINGTKIAIIGSLHKIDSNFKFFFNYVIKFMSNFQIEGYVTPETRFLSNPGNLVSFTDEIDSIRKEIEFLKNNHNDLGIFIALGHSGYDRDIEIAEKIPELDVVVGGHSHTYLFSGKKPPSSEKPAGKYPTIVETHIRTSTLMVNKTILVVQASAYGKYLGWLDLIFDKQGDIKSYRGEPIFLDHSFAEDSETNELIKSISTNISHMYEIVFAEATDQFSIQGCRSRECPMGNLIADSMIDRFAMILNSSQKYLGYDCDLISIVNGGNMRTSFDRGPITYRNILSTMPFGGSLGLLLIKGQELIQIFETSAEQHDRGGFLQHSGIRAYYHVKPSQRFYRRAELIDLKAKCHGRWRRVLPEQNYRVVVANFLVNGGDNYTINEKNWINYQILDTVSFSDYISKLKIITPKIEGRIVFVEPNEYRRRHHRNQNDIDDDLDDYDDEDYDESHHGKFNKAYRLNDSIAFRSIILLILIFTFFHF